MYKKFLLTYRVLNPYLWRWEDRESRFDTREEMIDFIKDLKKGTMLLKPEDIVIDRAYELNDVDIRL